ncbi:MAG: sugar phosphate isomerase/epimerase family protein [Candidatus Bathyarchaeia archaeon]
MVNYKLGCGTWPYMFPPYAARPYTLEECLEMISKLGFDGVELSGFKPHAHPDLYPSKRDRADLSAKIAGYGLEIAGIAADLSGYPIASPYEDVRRKHGEAFERFLEFCVDLDIKGMRVDTVSGPEGVPGVPYEDAWRRVVSTFKSYSEKAEDSGITLVWEFEPGFMFNKPGEVVKLLKEVNHPNFKAMVDTCHAHCCGIGLNQAPPLDVIDAPLSKIASEFIRRLKGWIGHVHLIDSNNTLNPHNTSTHCPFNLGVIDFDAVMQALRDVGYKGWLSLDLCFWPQAWEATEPCKKFLDGLKAKYD